MRFRRRQRLRRQADFAAMRKEGRRHFGAAFVLAVRERAPGEGMDLPRFAVVASRRVGSAVARNRIKRRMREIFRAHQALFPGNIDLVATMRTKSSRVGFAELETEFLAAARRAGFGRRPEGDRDAP